MENGKNKRIDFLQDKPALVRTFLFLLCLIFITLLVYIVGVLVITKNNYAGETADSDVFFKDCSLIKKDCLDTSCNYYSSCSGHDICRIYDCGGEYGIYSVDGKGQIEHKREAKPDMNAIESEKQACSGSMEILEQNCVQDRYQAKIKLTTKGTCDIGNFVVIFENEGSQPVNFTKSDDGVYTINSDRCGKAVTIAPVTKDGLYLEF